MSTHSLPPINYYQLEFEDKPNSLKGSAPTSNEFEYQQMGKGGKKINADGLMEDMLVPKEPQSGQFYVAICNSNDNKIETLVEINENDVLLF